MQYHVLRFAQQLDLHTDRNGGGLHLVNAGGRGMQAVVPGHWITFGIALSGVLNLQTQQSAWSIPQRDAFVWREDVLRIGAPRPGWWLVLSGPPAAWARALRARPDGAEALLPIESRCPRPALRLLVRMARLASHGRPQATEAEDLIGSLFSSVLEQQSRLQAALQRCTGRTLHRRRQTLLRLLRVQHLIRAGAEGKPDLARLARSASYSPCHLIRIYREVFGETPSEYAARLRFERAWRLVRDTGMSVCEITEALGFESQSAFCRAFKQSFGLTTTQARQLTIAERRAA